MKKLLVTASSLLMLIAMTWASSAGFPWGK
jgi:hypothetical protein